MQVVLLRSGRRLCALREARDNRLAMNEDTREAIARAFLTEMQASVRNVDFVRAYALFAEDVVAFGTYAAIVSGREQLEREQWRNVWPTIREFTFVLDELHCLGDDHTICVVVPWDSLGIDVDGHTFARPGRATLLLAERGGRWIAVHSHFSRAPVPTR